MKRLFVVNILILKLGLGGVFAQTAEKAAVLRVSGQVVRALKNKDMNRLAGFVHPRKGVRFSMYSSVDRKDRVFRAGELKSLLRSRKIYRWGVNDGTGAPVALTFAKYYERFVYDYDFARPEKINYNRRQNNGIMINNIAEFYPKGVEVEYFFDSTEDRMYGSLRLVYEKQGAQWFLVGIVRDTPGI